MLTRRLALVTPRLVCYQTIYGSPRCWDGMDRASRSFKDEAFHGGLQCFSIKSIRDSQLTKEKQTVREQTQENASLHARPRKTCHQQAYCSITPSTKGIGSEARGIACP